MSEDSGKVGVKKHTILQRLFSEILEVFRKDQYRSSKPKSSVCFGFISIEE